MRAAARPLAALALSLAAATCTRDKPPPPRGELTVSMEQETTWVRNFNPLSLATPPRWPTISGIYEPLFVHNDIAGTYVPWLATSYEWREGRRVLHVQTRPGVLWSDGQPFTAADVAFTFALLRKYPALDRRGVSAFVTDVRAQGDDAVDFTFSRVFLPGFDEIAPQPIVPEHVWKTVADPVTFSNENPVGTGPFTEVVSFAPQLFVLGKNKRYWQPGKPKVETLRFPSFPNNDRANLALTFGEVDWAGNFVPAIDRVFVSRDPANNAYWSPLTGSTIFLYPNTRRAPFDDVRARKAFSMAIDRDLLVDVALHGYSRPSDPTALSDAYTSWRDLESVDAADRGWVKHDADAAAKALDELGYRVGEDGKRHRPDGSSMHLEIATVSGWSDWVRAAQVIASGLREVKVDAVVRTLDFGAWFQHLQQGEFDLSLGWSIEGPTPYVFYRYLMASATVKPIGVPAETNWHRFASKTADDLLERFEAEPDEAAQHELVKKLSREFAAQAPAIPLYPNPSWAEYSTRRFTGFPTAANPFADPSPNKYERGQCLLVLTSLEPR